MGPYKDNMKLRQTEDPDWIGVTKQRQQLKTWQPMFTWSSFTEQVMWILLGNKCYLCALSMAHSGLNGEALPSFKKRNSVSQRVSISQFGNSPPKMSALKRKICSLYCLAEKEQTHTQVCYVSSGWENMKTLCYFLFLNIYYKPFKMC